MSPRFSASAPLDSMSEEELMVPERLALSFEVIPPRHDADEAKIDRLLETLESYHPDYIAVTSSKRSGWLEGTTAFIERISRTEASRAARSRGQPSSRFLRGESARRRP